MQPVEMAPEPQSIVQGMRYVTFCIMAFPGWLFFSVLDRSRKPGMLLFADWQAQGGFSRGTETPSNNQAMLSLLFGRRIRVQGWQVYRNT
jgi:hypothetical protein